MNIEHSHVAGIRAIGRPATRIGHGRVGYRPDIDGLRAVAVVLVLLYHLGVRFARGGLIGVDVFFVISGYLITSIILDDLDAGQFSLLRFYERRVRRIFPALFVVLVATTVVAVWLLLPSELTTYAKSLIAAVFFVANIFYYDLGGYFTSTAESQPLVHVWSLAVEEQFYVFFPLLLMALYRFRNGAAVAPGLILIALLSLGVSIPLVYVSPDAAFYLLPPRAWELLTGCILALGIVPDVTSKFARDILAAAGLVAILVAGAVYNRSVTFPGFAALVPCLGAAAIIHCGRQRDATATKLLASRPEIFIGLISYSLSL